MAGAISNVGYFFVRQKIEQATGQDIGAALRQLVFDALGINSAKLMRTVEDLADTAWGNNNRYDPGWVYHGLLAGSPNDAALFLQKLMSGEILSPKLLAEMTSCHFAGGELPERPWETTGYGLGLMIGSMKSVGMVMGHSGAGPGSACAVYYLRDMESPCTVAAFAKGDDQGAVEREIVQLAR